MMGGKNKESVLEALSAILTKFGGSLPFESALGGALVILGETFQRVSDSQVDVSATIRDSYLATLGGLSDECKKYSHLKKKLENRRL